ncbi:hypothetical protein [Methylocaldum marinum]|uniref:hypothetical protein n=1 Tax=Methylocaldum marinum TaxID=1432792 RepID=UPI001474210C|nr:hypothetical protein [Methylocaldum marinum]
MNPMKQRLDWMANPRRGCRERPVSRIEVRLSWGFSGRCVGGERERGLAREIGIGLIGKEVLVGEYGGDLFEHRTIIKTD